MTNSSEEWVRLAKCMDYNLYLQISRVPSEAIFVRGGGRKSFASARLNFLINSALSDHAHASKKNHSSCIFFRLAALIRCAASVRCVVSSLSRPVPAQITSGGDRLQFP